MGLEIWVAQTLQTSPFALGTHNYRFQQCGLAYTYISIFPVPFVGRAWTEHVQFVEPVSSYYNRVSFTLSHDVKTANMRETKLT